MNVLVIGSTYININIYDNEFDYENYLEEKFLESNIAKKKMREKETLVEVGGKGFNQLMSLKKLGIVSSAKFITALGDDKNAQLIIKHLKEKNINLDGIFNYKKQNTNGTYNFICNGKGYMYGMTKERVMNNLTKKNIIDNMILETDILLTHLEMNKIFFEYIIRTAKKHKKKIIVDPNPIENLYYLNNTIKDIDFITPNKYEYKNLQNELDENLLDSKKIIITKGEEGSTYNGKIIETLKINNSKNDIGTGDAFNGAFASIIMKEELSIEEKIYFSNCVAAIKTLNSTVQGVPNILELKRYAENEKKIKLQKIIERI